MTGSFAPPSDDVLARSPSFAAHRYGRFLVAELLEPHRVVSTSACGGGQRDDLRFLANHQSCEATDDRERHERIASLGPVAYHETVCREMGVDPDATALMGTAANMAYAVHRSADFDDLRVDVFATAGVAGNAARAGDPAVWTETGDGWRRIGSGPRRHDQHDAAARVPGHAGRARSRRRHDDRGQVGRARRAGRAEPLLADHRHRYRHGTSSASPPPLDPARPARTSTGPHAKAGGDHRPRRAGRDPGGPPLAERAGALIHARAVPCPGTLRPHRGGGDGARLAELLPGPSYELLDKNRRAVFYEPGVAAAAHALAAVLDRVAFGTLPAGTSTEALRQQAACLACALAARPEAWAAFRAELSGTAGDPVELVLRAIAVGWNAKWT